MKFVFDLDGTLCFDGMTMSKDLQKVLLTAPKYGHEIIFITACLVSQYRIPSSALRTIVSYCDIYNLPYFIDDTFNYAIQNSE